MRPPRWLRRPLLVGYAILVMGIVLGFYQVRQLNEALDQEVEFRQKLVCNSYQQLEDIVREIVNHSVSQEPVPKDINPELQNLIEANRERSRLFRAFANERLDDAECPRIERSNRGSAVLRPTG